MILNTKLKNKSAKYSKQYKISHSLKVDKELYPIIQKFRRSNYTMQVCLMFHFKSLEWNTSIS